MGGGLLEINYHRRTQVSACWLWVWWLRGCVYLVVLLGRVREMLPLVFLVSGGNQELLVLGMMGRMVVLVVWWGDS